MSMVTLGVSDLKRSVKFYSDLGFPRYGNEDEVAFFKLNGTWLGLYGKEALAEDANVSAEGSGFSGVTISHCLETEEEVIAAMEEAVAAGAEMVKAPQKVFWGGFSGYFKDPDGYLWELAMNPFTWIGPENMPVQSDEHQPNES